MRIFIFNGVLFQQPLKPRLYKTRLPAAQGICKANSIDKVIFKDKKKLGIVTSGKAYLGCKTGIR